MITIKDSWESFKEQCVNDDVSHSQLRDTKRAFYAGFIELLELAARLSEVEEEVGAGVLENLWEEKEKYAHDVVLGKE